MNFQDFMNEWVGRSVDYDHVFRFQCVDLILQYLYEGYGINGAYGNAIDFWTNPDPKLLARFHKVDGSDALTGDIVVFNGLPGNPFGHIGIATGNLNASALEVLEQNGQTGDGSGQAGDAIRTRYISRDRVAGLLRANADAPSAPPYWVEQIDPKQVKVHPGVHKWGMNYDNLPAMQANPIDTAGDNLILTVSEIVHHNIGYTYYRTAGDVDGWNTLDCDDYTPPAPKPYVPPAAPLPVAMATKITLVTDVPYFETPANAKNHYKEAGKLKAGEYFQFPSDNGMWNLSSSNMKDLQHWVNPSDNVAPVVVPEPPAPVPEPTVPTAWYNQITWLNNRLPVVFLPTTNYDNVKDYSDTRPEVYKLPMGQPVKVYGTITNPSQVKYYLLKLPNDVDFQYRFAVPMVDPETGKALLLKQAVKQVRNRDHITVIASEIEELGLKFIDSIIPKWYRKNNKKKG